MVGQAEQADTQIEEMRDWLRDSAGFAVGDDAWTQTESGRFAANILSYLAPGIAATSKVAKLGKLRKWTPKQTAAGIIGADSLAAFVVTDPTDMLSIGNVIGGPTAINPDDDAYTKKSKILAETAIFGTTLIGGLGYLGQAMKARRAANAEKAGKAVEDTPSPFDLDDTSMFKDGETSVESVLDGNTYTWQSGAWINALGHPAKTKNGFSNALTLQAKYPEAERIFVSQQAPGFLDLTEGRSVQYTMPKLISGETTVTMGGRKFVWGIKGIKGDVIAGPSYLKPRWINKASGRDATPAMSAKLNETFAPGLKEVQRKGDRWVNPRTGVFYPKRDKISTDLDNLYRSEELGNPNPPTASMGQTFGEASDASPAPRILTGPDDAPTGGGGGGAGPPTGGAAAAAEPMPSRWARARARGQKAGDSTVLNLGWMGAKAISPLNSLARDSVYFRRLRNTLEHFEESEAVRGMKGDLHDFYEHLHTTHGKYFGKMQDIMDKIYLATPEGMLTKIGRAIPGVRTMRSINIPFIKGELPVLPALKADQNIQIVRALRGGEEAVKKLPTTLQKTFVLY